MCSRGKYFPPLSPAVRLGLRVFFDHLLSAGDPTFTDSAASSAWALADVGQIQASGIMSGMGDDTFAPQGTYTREQTVATMMRLYD